MQTSFLTMCLLISLIQLAIEISIHIREGESTDER